MARNIMVEDTVSMKDFSEQKINTTQDHCCNGFPEKSVVGDLLADDPINLLALMVIEVERSVKTT